MKTEGETSESQAVEELSCFSQCFIKTDCQKNGLAPVRIKKKKSE